jgi:DNA-binding MarR family transcriptional regulator
MIDRVASFTELVLTVFRVNGALLNAGDALVRDTGLTSARWQVLGALANSSGSRTVPQIARAMGLTRQSVQRLVNDLERLGIVTLNPNPDHARAKLAVMTKKGEAAYAEALRRQPPWADELTRGLVASDIDAAKRVLAVIADRLGEAATEEEGNSQ